MRWVTYRGDGGERTGVLADDMVHALPAGATLLDLIALGADGLRASGEAALRSPAQLIRLDQVRLLAPIPRPPSIRDSLGFLDHMRNCRTATGRSPELADVWYRMPAFYFACPATVFGPYDDVPMAPGSVCQDFELEFAAVLGPAGADLSVEDAESAIIGYTIFNDWSARDLQLQEAELAIGQGKSKDSGVTLGPYLVTPDELEPYRRNGRVSLHATAIVNDVIVGTGSTGAMDWSFGEIISYVSRGVTLAPGDVIGSGTVPTCTLVEHLNPAVPQAFPGWLADGDVVTLQVQGLGEIRQTVRASAPPLPLPQRLRPEELAARGDRDADRARPRIRRDQ